VPKWRWIGSSGGGSNCSPVSSDSVSQLRATQSIYSIKTDLEGGTQSKVLVIVGPGGTGESYLIDTVAMYLEISRENAIKDAPETTINRRHKQLVKMAFTVVAAANVGGVTIHNALEVNSKEITGGVPKDGHNVELCAPPQRHQIHYQGPQRDFPGTCKNNDPRLSSGLLPET